MVLINIENTLIAFRSNDKGRIALNTQILLVMQTEAC